MSKHLLRELEKIKKQTLSLGTLVEERARMAFQAVESRDAELAQKIIDVDWEVVRWRSKSKRSASRSWLYISQWPWTCAF